MADSPISSRLRDVRALMRKAGVDVLIVRSTDPFLNEYVPSERSNREWLTGFTGSTGDALVAQRRAFVAVDGRYWLQGDRQCGSGPFDVLKVPFGTGVFRALADQTAELAARTKVKLKVGYEASKTTPAEREMLERVLGDRASLVGLETSPVATARGVDEYASDDPGFRALPEKRFGTTVAQKLSSLRPDFKRLGVDALLVQALDEIAYLSNLRGTELYCQATFRSVGLATPTEFLVGIDADTEIVAKERPNIRFVSTAEFWQAIGAYNRIGYDGGTTSELGRRAITKAGATPVAVSSPVGPMKAKKNRSELREMRKAFGKADDVVEGAIRWLNRRVVRGTETTERAFAEEVERRFAASGAVGLSFSVISAAGKNGAIIHYSDPSPKRVIRRGELLLLDTGGYWPAGYATDLTRTFLVDGPRGKATDEQRHYFTTVLKGAIAGMSAVLPVGAKGGALDALTRAPLWAEGLDFNHGTGHGVGINVHESPPRVGPHAQWALEEGHVFSIEPGVYLPKFGGIRIENLCTVVKAKGKKGFLQVVPLTFSPLDQRLIDQKRLTAREKAFLAAFRRREVMA